MVAVRVRVTCSVVSQEGTPVFRIREGSSHGRVLWCFAVTGATQSELARSPACDASWCTGDVLEALQNPDALEGVPGASSDGLLHAHVHDPRWQARASDPRGSFRCFCSVVFRSGCPTQPR